MSLLNQLSSSKNNGKKRVGRGYASTKGGHTAGRGQKGQKSRGGGKIPLWFEGGQLPLVKRLPFLRGKGRFKVVRPTAEVTLSNIEKMQATEISLASLKAEKVIDVRFKKAKIIATGKLTRKVQIKGIKVSKAAAEAIEALGGSVNS